MLPYDAEVEYLEATNQTEYIEIPFGFEKTDEVHLVCACRQGNDADYFLVSPKSWNNSNNRFAMAGSPKGVGFGYGTASTGTTQFSPKRSMIDTNFHEWIYASYVFSVPDWGLSYDVSGISFGNPTTELRLFFGYNSPSKGKIRSFYIIRDGVKVVDLIPVRVGSVGYMYDKVGGQLYGNLGSGSFTLGPDSMYININHLSLGDFRRRIMMGISKRPQVFPIPYIENGLVFYLDGINKGRNANAWTDLIGGIVFQNSGATEIANGWETGSGKKLINSGTVNFPSSTCTIEAVLIRNGYMTGGQVDVFNSLTGGATVLSFDNSKIYMARAQNDGAINCNAAALYDGTPLPLCISIRPGLAVVNGTSYTSSSGSSIGTATYNSIGSRGNGNYPLVGSIHAIRIYNRQLTAEEMLYNQQIDNDRFNLGLNI